MPDDLQLILLATLQHQLVTATDARRVGISEHRWRVMRDEGWWVPVSPTHYRHASTPLTLGLRVRAGLGWLDAPSAMYGSTALWWLGVAVPEPERPAFLVPRGRRSLVTGMELHTTTQWDPVDLTRHRGLATTTAARAIVDMAATKVRASLLEDAIDSAVSLRRTSFPNLTRRLEVLEGKGRGGCSLLRELLPDSGGESYLERRFLRLIRTAGLPRPRCQVVMTNQRGRPLRVDFTFGALMVEVSGRLGHVSDRDRQRAGRRRVDLEDQGFRVIEFTTADVVDDPDYVVSTVRRALHVTGRSEELQNDA